MPEKPGILIVDNEGGERERLVDTLSKKFPDYEIYSPDSGKEALDLLRQGGIDVVLSNLAMPKFSGLELARVVNKEYPGTPVIIMFEPKNLNAMHDVITEGVSACIKKPIKSIDTIAQSVGAAIERRGSFSRLNREMMRLLLEALPEAMIVIGRDKKVQFVNPPGMRLLKDEGITDGELEYEKIKSLVTIDPLELAKKHPPIQDMELSQVLYRLSVLPLHPDGSDRFGHLLILRDLSARSRTEQLQKIFLTLISHEFLTPLTIIESGLQLLDREKLSAKQIKTMVQSSRAQIHRMNRLVANIIDLAKITAKGLELKPVKVDVKKFFKEMVELFRVTIDRDGRKVRVVFAPTICSVMIADPDRLQQVFFNLIDNALKFSPKGSPVAIRVDGSTDELIVDVINSGPGIPLGQQKRIFSPFVQGEATVTHRVAGSGLGLTVVKSLVEAHKGRVELKSEVGRGATFRVIIPSGFTKS